MEIDAAWKRLFALPAMVEHLLRAVAPELARRLDFTAMEQLAANWTRPTDGADPRLGARPTDGADPRLGAHPTGGANPRPGAQRYADAVWRIRYAGADTSADARTLVLLLEFQSTVDPDMAARTLAYTSLLREHLRRQDRLDPDGGLRTLAVVVYSDPKSWSAAGAADAVPLSPDGTPLLTVVAPYRLLDSRRAPADDATERNPALAVLGVEGAASPAQAAARMQAMALWLPQVLADRDVRREFGASVAAWLAATMPRLFSSADGEEIGSIGLGLFEEDEMTTLHLRAKEWEAEWLRQGIAQGMEQGMERGLAQGVERGIAQGMERGLAQGVERGLAQGVERGLAQGVERGLAQGMERGLAQGVERGLAQGMERGIAQGMERGLAQERSLLCEQAARKFGAAVGEALARRLESASDAEALRDIGVLIIDCADGAELLARVPPRAATLEAPVPDLHDLQPRAAVRSEPPGRVARRAAGPCGSSRASPGRRCVRGIRGRPRRRTRPEPVSRPTTNNSAEQPIRQNNRTTLVLQNRVRRGVISENHNPGLPPSTPPRMDGRFLWKVCGELWKVKRWKGIGGLTLPREA